MVINFSFSILFYSVQEKQKQNNIGKKMNVPGARKFYLRNSTIQFDGNHRANKISPTVRAILASRRNQTEADEQPRKSPKYLIKKKIRPSERITSSGQKQNSKANDTCNFCDKVGLNQTQWCLPIKNSNSQIKSKKTMNKQLVYALSSNKFMKRKQNNTISQITLLNLTNIKPVSKAKANADLISEFIDRQRTKNNKKEPENQPNENNQICGYQIIEDKIIGAGTFGKVYLGRNCYSGQIVAIKKVAIDKSHKSRQIEIMQSINNKYVIKMVDKFITEQKIQDETKQFVNIVLPKYQSSFFDFLKPKNYSLRPQFLKLYLFQILKGVMYLHSKGICHRDLKPQNILINKNQLVICDLGSAKILKKDQPNIAYICSRCYRAPELMFGSTSYDVSIDMWSVGCIILQILNKGPFFIAKDSLHHLIEIMKVMGTPSNKQIMSMNPSYDIQFSQLPIIRKTPWKEIIKTNDQNLLDLISKIMVYDPNIRLTAYEALCHPYFSEINTKQFKESIGEEYNQDDLLVFHPSTSPSQHWKRK